MRHKIKLGASKPIQRESRFAEMVMFYDKHFKLWTVYPLDQEGNQMDIAEYFHNQSEALKYIDEFMKLYEGR